MNLHSLLEPKCFLTSLWVIRLWSVFSSVFEKGNIKLIYRKQEDNSIPLWQQIMKHAIFHLFIFILILILGVPERFHVIFCLIPPCLQVKPMKFPPYFPIPCGNSTILNRGSAKLLWKSPKANFYEYSLTILNCSMLLKFFNVCLQCHLHPALNIALEIHTAIWKGLLLLLYFFMKSVPYGWPLMVQGKGWIDERINIQCRFLFD